MKEFQVKPENQAFLFYKKPESGFFLEKDTIEIL